MDSKDLVESIKKAAIDAVNASKPADIVFGSVISASPLKIQTEQKIVLGEAQLSLCKSLTTRTETMIIDGETKSVVIYGGISAGDRVMMIRAIGGQKYVVVDKIL